jgi:hypothetical protein
MLRRPLDRIMNIASCGKLRAEPGTPPPPAVGTVLVDAELPARAEIVSLPGRVQAVRRVARERVHSTVIFGDSPASSRLAGVGPGRSTTEPVPPGAVYGIAPEPDEALRRAVASAM